MNCTAGIIAHFE